MWKRGPSASLQGCNPATTMSQAGEKAFDFFGEQNLLLVAGFIIIENRECFPKAASQLSFYIGQPSQPVPKLAGRNSLLHSP